MLILKGLRGATTIGQDDRASSRMGDLNTEFEERGEENRDGGIGTGEYDAGRWLCLSSLLSRPRASRVDPSLFRAR